MLHTDEKELVIADIPGLIEGAAEGKGLGHEFLRHIERTKVLTLVIPADSADPIKEFTQLRNEVEAYSKELGMKPYIVVVSKSELNPHVAAVAKTLKTRASAPVFVISAHTHFGLDDLVRGWQKLLDTDTATV